MLAGSATWNNFSWDRNWLRWYNETGGGCAIDASPDERASVESVNFAPLDDLAFYQTLTGEQLAQIERVLAANPALQAQMNALYQEAAMIVLTNGVVSAEFLAQAETIYQALLTALEAEGATDLIATLETMWAAANIAQYENQAGRAAWTVFNLIPTDPTAIALSTLSLASNNQLPIVFIFTMLLTLLSGYAVLKRE